MNLLILPNQLFEKKYLPKNINKIILLEEPTYFGHRDKKYNFNKLKLILHRASMKFYFDYLKSHNYKIEYININKINYNKILKNQKILMFKPYDYFLEKKYKKYNSYIKYIKNPNFLLSEKQLEKFYIKLNGKNPKHSNFYNFIKQELNILKNEKTYDKMNRNKLPKNIIISKLPKIHENNYIKEAKKYIQIHFKNNYGNIENFIYPINYIDSNKWLNNFINNKLKYFGEYQDAIDENNNFLFHSIISPMLNIGLLSPDKIIKKIVKINNIKINNIEGFIRQIIGWREYNRFCYIYYYDQMKTTNIFNNKNKLNKNWYTGNTGLYPLDNTIKYAFDYGYLHHILRLMVMGNLMNLCNIHPDEVYKWFMEFSVDSYDWVMIMNVYSMSLWSDKGLTMSKPYISTDNYIMKMSNYKKNKWNSIWKSLFYNFLNNNKNIIKNTPYNRNYQYFDNLQNNKKNDMIKIAKNFIKNNIKF